MARRVIYRDNSLVFGNPPNGYKFVGYNGVTFSQLDFSGNVTPIGGGSGGGSIGPGTINYVPKWSSSSTLSSASNIYDTGQYVGIGTASPIYPFQVFSPTGSFYVRPSSSGLVTELFGSNITQLSVQTAAYLTYSSCGVSMGMRAWNEVSFPGYGKKGDAFIYSSADANGLNIISQDGSSTDDYIRFYAGGDASSTPDIHITGRGLTRGFVGIGTSNPSYKLHLVTGTISSPNIRGNYITSVGSGKILNLEYSNGENNLEFYTFNNSTGMFFNNSGIITAGTSSLVQFSNYFAFKTSTLTYFNLLSDGVGLLSFGDDAENDQIRFQMNNGSGTLPTVGGKGVYIAYNLRVNGTLSKAAGTFQIDHPLPSKKETHTLIHSFVEAPQANNIYRGKSQLQNGTVEINLDSYFRMTEGTLIALNKNLQCFTSNETGWDSVKGSVNDNILTINCINTNSSDEVSWLVIGERHDDYILQSGLYDENEEFIVEKQK